MDDDQEEKEGRRLGSESGEIIMNILINDSSQNKLKKKINK